MEINNISDALLMNGVSEIIQYCTCTYEDKVIKFRLINDDIGVVDLIEYNIDGEWISPYEPEDEKLALAVEVIEGAPYEVFHKSNVGAELRLNHESIKPQNLPNHLKTTIYDDEEGPILFKLNKNVIQLD